MLKRSSAKHMYEYQKQNAFEARKSESNRIMVKYPERIPIICEPKDKKIILSKKKFLVPRDLTTQQFLNVLRKHTELKPQEAMFVFVNNNIPANMMTMNELYKNEKNEDGFLYFVVSLENTFGSILINR